MNKDLIWNFPVSGKSTKFSSDNNNIDTFADDRLGNLTREIIQNSLDATIDGQITKVEFKRFKTLTSDFPALDSYKKYFELLSILLALSIYIRYNIHNKRGIEE